MREQPIVLEHEPDRALRCLEELARGGVVDYLAVEQDATVRHRHQSGRRVEQGGLTGAVRPEDPEHLARGHAQVDAQGEVPAGHLRVDDEPLPDPERLRRHGVEPPRSHLSRSVTSTVMDTTRSTRLSTIAASGSVSSA